MRIVIQNGKIVLPSGVIKGNVIIENKKITEVTQNVPEDYHEIFEANSFYVMPGFIDLQTNGVGGNDVMEGNERILKKMVEILPAHGVTGFLPTIVTGEQIMIENALQSIAAIKHENRFGSEIIGAHIEGPYITNQKGGAHDRKFIRAFSCEEFERWNETAKGHISIITLAPEVNENNKYIGWLKEKGIVVSVGHSNATYNETKHAFDEGISYATHLFNGMGGIHQREPGVVGAVLENDDVYASFIPDLYHVHPSLLKLIYSIKGRRKCVIVTDQMFLAGLPSGDYMWGDQEVYSDGVVPRIKSTGRLAGSLLLMNRAIKNMVEVVNVPIEDAVYMATMSPAAVLGIENEVGSIEVGKKANITILDQNFDVVGTMRDGKWVYKK